MRLQLSGRLGNQLFQLAFAHELSRLFSERVQLFYDDIHHANAEKYDLIAENFSCCHVSSPYKNNFLGQFIRFLDKLNKMLRGVKIQAALSHLGIFRQLDSHNFNLMLHRKPWLVTGFYINKDFVSKNENTLIAELGPILKSNLAKMEKLNEILVLGDYQLMHVRRGDYVDNPDIYGLLTVGYYEKLREKLPLVLLVENLTDCEDFRDALKPSVILTKTDADAWQALAVMQRAKNLVMSNSTFAWWGGVLAANNGATVTMPAPFYKSSSHSDQYLNYDLFLIEESVFV